MHKNNTLNIKTEQVGGFEIIARYETGLTNNLYRAFRELRSLQFERKSKE